MVLHSEEVFRQIEGLGKLADGHRDLVAGVSSVAVTAVFEDLVAKGESLGGAEVKVFEEGRDASEEADALDAFGFGLAEDGLNEETSGSVAFGLGEDDDGADLRKVLTVDVQSCAAEKPVCFGFYDGEGSDVGADLIVGATKKCAVVGEALNELVDGVSVLQIRSAGAHEVWLELDAKRDGERL